MTPEECTLLMLKGLISQMPTEDIERIDQCVLRIRSIVAEFGDNGRIALALLGAELGAETA